MVQIAISGKFSNDVFDAGIFITDELRDHIRRVDISDVPTELKSLVFFPVIFADDLEISMKSHRSFSRKENAEFANVEIPHEAWVLADEAARVRMMHDALERAIRESTRISPEAAMEITRRLSVNLNE